MRIEIIIVIIYIIILYCSDHNNDNPAPSTGGLHREVPQYCSHKSISRFIKLFDSDWAQLGDLISLLMLPVMPRESSSLYHDATGPIFTCMPGTIHD